MQKLMQSRARADNRHVYLPVPWADGRATCQLHFLLFPFYSQDHDSIVTFQTRNSFFWRKIVAEGLKGGILYEGTH